MKGSGRTLFGQLPCPLSQSLTALPTPSKGELSPQATESLYEGSLHLFHPIPPPDHFPPAHRSVCGLIGGDELAFNSPSQSLLLVGGILSHHSGRGGFASFGPEEFCQFGGVLGDSCTGRQDSVQVQFRADHVTGITQHSRTGTAPTDAIVFDLWSINSDAKLDVNVKENPLTFKMPAQAVTIEAMTQDATIESEGPGVLGTAAMIM